MKMSKIALWLISFVFSFLVVSFFISAVMSENFKNLLFSLFGVVRVENFLDFLADFTMILSLLITILIYIGRYFFYVRRQV